MNLKQNEGVLSKPLYGLQVASFEAGSTYDDVDHDLGYIDRLGYDCLQVQLHSLTSITAAKKLNWTVTIKDCATSGGSYTDYVTAVAADTEAVAGATTAAENCDYVNVDLTGAERYVKAVVNLDLTHTSTDTCQAYLGYLLTGANSIPVS